VPWRWYSFDPGTLRLADARYRLGHHQRFGYFSKTGLPWRALVRQAAARTPAAPASQPEPGSPAAADRPLNDLQQRILTLTRELRKRGHPPNTP
jgi:hypothetical protein